MIWKGSSLGFTPRGRPITYEGDAATLIFGPPGSSKTVGVIVNQLLDEPGRRSFLVIDPKGEVAAITARYRRCVCGAKNVKIINPYGLLVEQRADLKSDKWNPLGDHDPASLKLGDHCGATGDALIKSDSNEHQKHFPDSARSGLTGAMIFEVRDAHAKGQTPSLANVRATLTQEPKALRVSVERMMKSGDFDITSRLAKFLADTDEIGSIKSTIETNTAWMTKAMRDDMATDSGVSFRAMTERPTTIYVILPTEELQNKAVYLRLVLSSALRALYRQGGVPATLLIEEGFVLGHHTEILSALSILRGFGSRMTIVFQSLQQIKNLYHDTWGLFMSGAVLGFRPGDLETAEWMSKRASQEFAPVPSYADPNSPTDVGVKPSWRPEKRDRIPIGKMFAMPQARALVWLPCDEAPRIAHVRGYFEIPELAARADPNPYYKPPHRSRRGMLAIGAAAAIVGLVVLSPIIRPGLAGWAERVSTIRASIGSQHQATPHFHRHKARAS